MNHDPITREPGGQRQAGRVQPYWLECDLGLVVDVSASGARILSKKRLEGSVDLRIWTRTNGVSVRAEVVRSQKIKFRQHEIALRFVDLDDDAAASLASMASHQPQG